MRVALVGAGRWGKNLRRTRAESAACALVAVADVAATARADARKLAVGVRADAAAERAKATAEADAKLAQRLAAAEQRLAAQRVEGLKAADEAAADVAQAIYAKLAGSAA